MRAIETDSGAGGSAQREYAHRRGSRRARAKARYGALGSVLAALNGDPASVQAWRLGAEGEIATARALAWRLHRSDVVVLHDRRIPGRGRANIDHIAIGPGGVTVIDSKSSRGRIQLGSAGMIHRHQVLLVNGRDRTRQLDALERQITPSPPLSGATTPVRLGCSARCASRSCAARGFTPAVRATG